MAAFHRPGGDRDFRSGKPAFFNKRRRRRPGRGGSGPRHPGLAERDPKPVVPQCPATPPPAAFEANVFGKLDIRLQHAIAEAGYAVPTPIQQKAIEPLLEGRDLIGCAQTGTGKTAAFMLPILHRLVQERPDAAAQGGPAGHPRALVLSPTRELAAQIAENVEKYAKYTGLSYAVVFGGVSQFPQVKALQRGADVVVATPGRLMDLMTQGVVFLDQVEMFVLDEADRMLDMGFLPDIKRIIAKLPPNRMVAGAHGAGHLARQSLFFSATLSPEILKLAGELVVDPLQIMISPETPTVEKINQKCMLVEKGSKDSLLIHLLETHSEWFRVIVFARTRHGADRVERKLRAKDIPAAAIHSDKTQNMRTRALQGFKSGKIRVLVATDIASRGIDVPDVDLVVNMELPIETESYVHRIGRTARAGESGAAISFVAPEERGLLKAVERFIRKSIQIDRDQPFHSAEAERQVGKQHEGLPQAPWIRGGAANRKGKARHPGSRFFGGPKNGKPKKFVHPANAKRSHRKRTNYQGRREADFGQK
ncbi:MAG: DEAD/DEAH box helicase [Kiritimatiellia bacterium]